MLAFVMPRDGLRMGLPQREGYNWNERETSKAFDGHMSYGERLESRRSPGLCFSTRYLSDRVVWGLEVGPENESLTVSWCLKEKSPLEGGAYYIQMVLERTTQLKLKPGFD